MDHYKKELQMSPSTYDLCLLILHGKDLGIVVMQTGDTLILGEYRFSILEEKLNFTAKPKEIQTPKTPLNFNECILSLDDTGRTIHLWPKGQGEKIQLVDPPSLKTRNMSLKIVTAQNKNIFISEPMC